MCCSLCVCCISVAVYESLLWLMENNFLPLENVCVTPCRSFVSLVFAFLGLKHSYILFYHCPYNCCILYIVKVPKLIHARKLLSANEVDFACLLWSYGCNRSLIIVFLKCQSLSAYQEWGNSCAFKSPDILRLWGDGIWIFFLLTKALMET